MIKLIEYIDSEICKVNSLYNALSEKIVSTYNLHDNTNKPLIYSQTDDNGNVTGIILNSLSDITVSVNEQSDVDELKDFLNCIGYKCVKSNREIDLNNKNRQGFIVEYVGDKTIQTKNAEIISSEEIKNIFPLIKQCFETEIDFSEWFCDCSHKIRHSKAAISAVKIDERYVSSATCMFKTDCSATMLSVCTDKNFRKSGYASDCIYKLINDLDKKNNKDVFLLCEDKMIEFYKRIGFKDNGRWYEYVQ